MFDSRWLKLNDAAEICRMSARTLRDQAFKGKLRAQKSGKNWFVDVTSLLERGLLEPGTSIQPAMLHQTLKTPVAAQPV